LLTDYLFQDVQLVCLASRMQSGLLSPGFNRTLLSLD
jgi:hypothetical protein